MSELISIITPLYNSEEFILDMIKSVQAQTYQNWEMIVVDDCSQDGGPNIVKKMSKTDERIKLISQKQHSGPSHVRNVAIELAKGRYLAFLDSDDLWHEQKLNKQLNFMKKNHYAFLLEIAEICGRRAVVTSTLDGVAEKWWNALPLECQRAFDWFIAPAEGTPLAVGIQPMGWLIYRQ